MNILLQCCCGPCATSCVEWLTANRYVPTLFYANDNIDSEEEWTRRLQTLHSFASQIGVGVVVSPYRPGEWRTAIATLENEPEGGKRCSVCFAHNFGLAVAYAKSNGFQEWTTTLSVSPHKSSATLFEVGNAVSAPHGIRFMSFDFAKNDGFKRSVELAKRYQLYRQRYCGCAFSDSVSNAIYSNLT